MSDNRRQIEAMLFKPVPGGFIYRAPNPWILGYANHYLVNEAQKAELLRIVVAPRPILRLATIVALVLWWVVAMATVAWAFSGHDDPTAVDAVIMSIATFAAMFLATTLRAAAQTSAGATDARSCDAATAIITSREMRSAVNKTTSLKTAVIVGAIWPWGARPRCSSCQEPSASIV